jgi:hypothetical protein
MRPIGPKQQGISEIGRHFGRHAVVRIGFALGRIPEVMRHVFQGQAFRRRPRQRRAGYRLRPPLKVCQIGRQRTQGVLAHALAGGMLQRFDVIVGEELGEPIAPRHRQDRGQRVELEGAPGFGIGDQRSGGDVVHKRRSVKAVGSIRLAQQHAGVRVGQAHALGFQTFSDREPDVRVDPMAMGHQKEPAEGQPTSRSTASIRSINACTEASGVISGRSSAALAAGG